MGRATGLESPSRLVDGPATAKVSRRDPGSERESEDDSAAVDEDVHEGPADVDTI
jgi:hypothetical protein